VKLRGGVAEKKNKQTNDRRKTKKKRFRHSKERERENEKKNERGERERKKTGKIFASPRAEPSSDANWKLG